jgi:hypothetical protein
MTKIFLSKFLAWIIPLLLAFLGTGSLATLFLTTIFKREIVLSDKDKLPFPEKKNNEDLVIYIPVPTINLKRFLSFISTNHPDVFTNYLNHLSKVFDFLHKNYINYIHKLSYENTGKKNEILEKRLRPIVIKEKFEIAKKMLMSDLRDMIEATSLQILIYRQQVHQLQLRSPPSIFLADPKYAPYYWILTDVDYSEMHPTLRHVMQFYRKRSTQSTLLNEQTTDMLERFLTRHGTIERRYLYLMAKFFQQNRQNYERKLAPKEQREEFGKFCYEILRKRIKNIRTNARKIRKDKIRVLERERSKHMSEYNKLRGLQLQEPQFNVED